jgi:hypothetical protein
VRGFRDGSKVAIVPAEKIDFIEAQDDYVAIVSGGKKYLKQQTLGQIEGSLDPARFVRIHRSYLLNLERLAKIEASVQQIPDVPTNSQVKLKAPTGLVEKRGQEFADDLTAFLGTQAEIVTPMWNSPVQSFGNDQVARAIEKIYTKAQSVKEALAEAQAASQAELERVLAG